MPSLARRAGIESWLAVVVSDALRRRSLEELTAALGLLVRLLQREKYEEREVLICLAPLHDCVRRLGADPATVFEAAAAAAPLDLADLLRTFGARDEVILATFGWVLDDDPDVPRYWIAD